MKKIKKMFEIFTHRVVIVVLFMLLQFAALVSMVLRFSDLFPYYYYASTIAGAAIILYIVNGKSNPAYKLAWIIPILVFPIWGGLCYLVFGRVHLSDRQKRRLDAVQEKLEKAALLPTPLADIEDDGFSAVAQSHYILTQTAIPPYPHTQTEYLPLGEIKFRRLKEELEKAEHYIFLEYFIIEEGVMWNQVLEILARKAAQGVDVRVIYDDMGCMFTLPYRYDRHLEAMGIKSCIFNPFVPVLSSLFNNRDHRKIAVIDGLVGFTGGINLADEYINVKEKHGHWKDTAILLRGEAVWGLTVIFLSTWDYIRGEEQPYLFYRPRYDDQLSNGFVQPYWDSPLDGETVGANVYLNIIYRARRYVYITTPYLILDNETMTALTTAAKCGVDVRIITPHIGDKWYVHSVTRANYSQLLESGVSIYEYTPGFMHAKTFVADDKCAVVGTVNLDYRSLYLHYECGVWMYKADAVAEVRDDFLRTLSSCHTISLESCRNTPLGKRLVRAVLRPFAPLM